MSRLSNPQCFYCAEMINLLVIEATRHVDDCLPQAPFCRCKQTCSWNAHHIVLVAAFQNVLGLFSHVVVNSNAISWDSPLVFLTLLSALCRWRALSHSWNENCRQFPPESTMLNSVLSISSLSIFLLLNSHASVNNQKYFEVCKLFYEQSRRRIILKQDRLNFSHFAAFSRIESWTWG